VDGIVTRCHQRILRLQKHQQPQVIKTVEWVDLDLMFLLNYMNVEDSSLPVCDALLLGS
jgi:hypothetical protein